mmetsp:Transcript_40481/g.84241  ORF Transcript_40481/g.84241 Transcript_40481/m.84241 type:complete len:130 (+) Transcript_40481:1424-1813(+)
MQCSITSCFKSGTNFFFKKHSRLLGTIGATMIPASFGMMPKLAFFDYMVIPLTKKLKESGVFGNSSDEYLEYALKNRREWILKGKEVIESMSKSAAGPKDAAAAGVSETPPAAKNTEVSEELKVEGSLA